MKFYDMAIQMKATEQYFPVVLFIMLYKVVLTFQSVDEIYLFPLRCTHVAPWPLKWEEVVDVQTISLEDQLNHGRKPMGKMNFTLCFVGKSVVMWNQYATSLMQNLCFSEEGTLEGKLMSVMPWLTISPIMVNRKTVLLIVMEVHSVKCELLDCVHVHQILWANDLNP